MKTFSLDIIRSPSINMLVPAILGTYWFIKK